MKFCPWLYSDEMDQKILIEEDHSITYEDLVEFMDNVDPGSGNVLSLEEWLYGEYGGDWTFLLPWGKS